MRILSREALGKWLAKNAIDRDTMTWKGSPAPFRLLIRVISDSSQPFEKGPHRRVMVPGEDTVLKISVGDRPGLSRFVSQVVSEMQPPAVCAFGSPQSYWMNNRGYAAYLAKVGDAQRLHRFLRRAGLTNRFRGGFLVRPHEYESHLGVLASQPFCGGPDVLFASADPPFLILACHKFDLHVETRDVAIADRIGDMALSARLDVRRSDLGTPDGTDSD